MVRGGRNVLRHHQRYLGESRRGLAVFEVLWDADEQPVDFVVVGLNDSFAELFGTNVQDVMRTRISESMPELFRDWHAVLVETAQTNGEQEMETWHPGLEAWLKISFYSPAPNLVGLVLEDVTPWIETAAALAESQIQLRENENFLQTILDNAPVSIWVTDPHGNRIMVNKRYMEDTGIGTPHPSVTPEEMEMCRLTDMKTLMSDTPQEYEEQLTFRDGKKHTLRTIKSVLRKDNGEIIGVLGIGVDITALKQAEQELWKRTYIDPLTGLYNRRYLEEEMRRLDQGGKLPTSVVIADLDGLKLINDAFGHQEGDRLLCAMADVFRRASRPSDILARWAGDEFVVLLPETSYDEAKHYINRVGYLCEGLTGNPIPLIASLGAATRLDRRQTMSEVFAEAEKRMYKRKTLSAKDTRAAFALSLKRILLERSDETEAHMANLQILGQVLGEAIGLDNSHLYKLQLLAVYHDIGLVRIPESLLRKRGNLTPEEVEILKTHTETGYRIASIVPDFQQAADAILAHHECWDGSGYPKGLQGAEIPITARIHAITDRFDTLLFGRPNSPAVSLTSALRELKVGAGTLYDPELVDQFVRLVRTTDVLDFLQNSNPAVDRGLSRSYS